MGCSPVPVHFDIMGPVIRYLGGGGGGLQNDKGGGGEVKLYPYKRRRGGGTKLVIVKGATKSCGVVLTQAQF